MAQPVRENPFIGQRISLLREELMLSQEKLSEKLGFSNRQTLQTIESGTRRLRVDELMALIEFSGRPLEFFTDPFRWVGEGTFSFRVESSSEPAITDFEQIAGSCTMLWRWLAEINEVRPTSRPGIDIAPKSTFEDVLAIANKLAEWFDLGDVPAEHLANRIEDALLIPVLYVDSQNGISGATVHHEGQNIIFINRNDVLGRRNFDLAHELFHALTWSVQPPARLDTGSTGTGLAKRWEQFADNFASALLMPDKQLLCKWAEYSEVGKERLHTTESIAKMARKAANHFHVTPIALFWRLVSLGLLDKDIAQEFKDSLSMTVEQEQTAKIKTPILSRLFLEQLSRAIDSGRISVRKAASLVQLDIDLLAKAYDSQELPVPFDI